MAPRTSKSGHSAAVSQMNRVTIFTFTNKGSRKKGLIASKTIVHGSPVRMPKLVKKY